MLAYGLLAAVGAGPQRLQDQVLDTLSKNATAVMTNVPGPQQALYFAGAKIDEIMFWVPQSGNIGMGVSILTYDGRVQFGLVTDKKLVPDPEAIIAGFAPEFEKLVMMTLMGPWEGEAASVKIPRPDVEPAEQATVIEQLSGDEMHDIVLLLHRSSHPQQTGRQ